MSQKDAVPRNLWRSGKPNTVTCKAVSGNGGVKDLGGCFSNFGGVRQRRTSWVTLYNGPTATVVFVVNGYFFSTSATSARVTRS